MPAFFPRAIRVICLTLTLTCFPPLAFAGSWIGGIEFDHPSPCYLPNGEYVEVSIDYKVADPAGAHIYAVPYTNGFPTVGYSYTGGSVPAGESTVTRFFSISSGQEMVDHVKISMRSADNTMQILELFVRVKYVYGPCGIYNIQINQNEHSVLANGTSLNIGFDYGSPGPDNVRIFARPYFDGSLVGGYVASAGYAGGPTGSGTQSFQFPTVDADINQIHFKITNLDQTETLLEFDHAVEFCWRDVGITNIAYSIPSPSMVHHEDNVDITFDYDNTTGQGIRIWFMPYEDGAIAAGGVYAGSAIIPPGSGSLTRYIGSVGNTHANQAYLRVRREADTHLYVERFIPVEYTFAPHVVTNVTMSPRAPALLDHDEILQIEFDYRTDLSDSILIHAWPMTRGRGNPGGRSYGSQIYTTPTGHGDYEIFLAEGYGEPEVDQLQFAFYSYSEIDFLGDWYLDTTHLWGPSASVMPVPGLAPNMLVSLGQNYPNPFNPVTTIPVTLSRTRHVRLMVFDLRGRLVRVLADEVMGIGRHEIPFDGTGLASGSFHYRLEGAGPAQTGSMMLVK